MTATCRHCGWSIYQVPGGHGLTWVHLDGHVVSRENGFHKAEPVTE